MKHKLSEAKDIGGGDTEGVSNLREQMNFIQTGWEGIGAEEVTACSGKTKSLKAG